MVFRKENKVDAFQRQISALRQQLGTGEEGLEDGQDGDHLPPTEEAHVAAPAASSLEANQPSSSSTAFSFSGFGGPPVGAPTPSSRPQAIVPEPPMLPSPVVANAQTSVVAHDTVWKGELQTTGTLHVHGRVEGAIDAKEDVYVAEEADVDATITAKNVVIAGMVRGTVRCGERFEVLPQGRVAGDVQAPTLVVHEGASVTGQFRMGPPEPGLVAEPSEARPSVVQRRAARGGR